MSSSPISVPWRAVLVAAAWLAGLYGITASVPFLSEDWTHMEMARGYPSLLAAMDPAREPLRPLQHAFLWCLAHCGFDPTGVLPTAARAVMFVLFGVACGAVLLLAREAGLATRATGIALLLFVAFPNVKAISWAAAIGSPGRVAFELVALLCLVRRVRGGSAWYGAAGVVAFLVALGFHESAFLLPAILAAWVACVGVDGLRAGVRRAAALLQDPFVLATCAIAAAHAIHLAFLRPGRVHGRKELAAVAANAAKALFSLLPEPVREIGIEGLRGNRGTVGVIAACVAAACVLALFFVALRRGGLLRCAAIAVALDLALAVVAAGFVQRYAIFASAFAALALSAWATTRARYVAVLLVGVTWLVDAYVDARELREAGRGAVRLADEARVLAGTSPLAIVGVPGLVGSEGDVPYFNWGGTVFLRAHGVRRPVHLLRERTFATNSDQEFVDDARLRALRESGVDVRRWTGFDTPLATSPP